MAYYKKKRALVGGDHVSVGARGKRAIVDKGDNTKMIDKRGKRVSVDKKKKIISISSRNKKLVKGKGKTISRRGKTVAVLNRVRS